MTRKLILIGGGGHALSLLDILPSSSMVTGYVDIKSNHTMPIPYLGSDDAFMSAYDCHDCEVVITAVTGSDCILDNRRNLVTRYSGYNSPVIVASSAIMSSSSLIGSGSAVFHRVVVNAGCSIGKHCIINTGAIIEHGCVIGDNTFVGPGCVVCGGVTIGDNVYIGAGAIIKPGINICNDAIIGAGAVVISNIISKGTYVDVPAKPIKK